MEDPGEPTPRRGSEFDGAYEDLYRSSKPRRLYVEDDDETAIRPRKETLWRADDDHVWETALGERKPELDDARVDPAARKPRTATDDEPEPRFRRTVGFTLLSTVLPGLGLVGSKHRGVRLVGILTAVTAVAVAVALTVFFVTRVNPDPGQSWFNAALTTAVGIVSQRATLHVLTVLIVTLGLLWIALIAGTHIATRPRGIGSGKRFMGAFLVAVLSLGIAAPLAVGARYSQVLASSIGNTFVSQEEVKSKNQPVIEEKGPNPFAGTPRLNILLLGADMDELRTKRGKQQGFGLRTDTIMVASIDTETGATAIIQIPRNVQFTPFPRGSEMRRVYPKGFRGEPSSDFHINSVWDRTESEHKDLFKGSTYPGAEGLKQAVEGITGLPIHYFVLINMDGMRNLVDALGGVTVNVNRRLPIGGSSENKRATSGWLEPGPNQRYDGYHALWYARSRWSTSDYDRMGRQSCLIKAIIDEASPTTLLTRFEAIAGASSDMVMTDIPHQALEPLTKLGLKVKDQKMQRLVFSQGKNGYRFENPDFKAMRAAVDELIDPKPSPSPSADPSPTATKSAKPSPSPSPGEEETPKGPLVDGSQDVDDACAYNPIDEEE